jgi:phosphoribosylformylglycinamidine synthase subunit PurL
MSGSGRMDNTEVNEELALKEGLTKEEYRKIIDILHRKPTFTELGMFMSMWSEHCSYKSSRIHLKKLPTEGEHIIQGPGENAGIIDIGDNLALVFKIESHNHPSFVEPYQGAATGVGGIIRDIFTMGARPLALLDSLRFGPLDNPKNRYIFSRVVAGIAGYGNCMGIPTIGGEVYFDDCYSNNPLVNAFCLGVVEKDKIFYGKAKGEGNLVVYMGSKTGRDGIHGASLLASQEFDDLSSEMKPTVQVGDPFSEKMLMEACLDLMDKNLVIGIQDMGAAGLTCSITEMASRGGTGMDIDISLVPLREKKMSSYEIMLSESQERMLLVISEKNRDEVFKIINKWDLDAVTIGKVTTDGIIKIKMNNEPVVEVPAHPLAEQAPIYDRPSKKPEYLDKLKIVDLNDFPIPEDLDEIILKLVSNPILSSKKWVFTQYDHMVRTNTLTFPEKSDAAVIRLKGTKTTIGMSLDCNPLYCYLDPEKGAKIAVAESARNLVAAGFKPVAITNCLNFGNPEDLDVMWQFTKSIDGLSKACEAFKTPVTGGNVSFYNETKGEGIYPTPVIGMVGIQKGDRKPMTIAFKNEGDIVIIIGKTIQELGASQYLSIIHNCISLPVPEINLDSEKVLHDLMLELVTMNIINSAHDISDGGLVLAALESAFASENNLGIDIDIDSKIRADAYLFGETQGRILISIKPDNYERLLNISKKYGYPVEKIGIVKNDFFSILYNGNNLTRIEISDLRDKWENSIHHIMNQ